MSTIPPKGDPLARALAAYFRTGGIDQPSRADSGLARHDGRDYVILRNVNGTLAVYRVLTSGLLKRLRRWPSELEES